MDTSEKREPLLSDGVILEMDDQELDKYSRFNFAHRVRDFYEAKIASGELRVVRKAINEHAENHINTRTFYCSNCHIHTERVFRYAPTGSPRTVKFCPGCGAQITE